MRNPNRMLFQIEREDKYLALRKLYDEQKAIPKIKIPLIPIPLHPFIQGLLNRAA